MLSAVFMNHSYGPYPHLILWPSFRNQVKRTKSRKAAEFHKADVPIEQTDPTEPPEPSEPSKSSEPTKLTDGRTIGTIRTFRETHQTKYLFTGARVTLTSLTWLT